MLCTRACSLIKSLTESNKIVDTENQIHLFPVPKTLWVELIALLETFPWKLANAFHIEAKKAMAAADTASPMVSVHPEVFNQTVNMLADQPHAVVAPLLTKIADHVAASVAQVKAEAEATAMSPAIVADGVTDDTAANQARINAGQSNSDLLP